MKLFRVTYEGLWLGGVAIVQADSVEDAKQLVENHPDTVEFNDVTVEELPIKRNQPAVLFNYNGDY